MWLESSCDERHTCSHCSDRPRRPSEAADEAPAEMISPAAKVQAAFDAGVEGLKKLLSPS